MSWCYRKVCPPPALESSLGISQHFRNIMITADRSIFPMDMCNLEGKAADGIPRNKSMENEMVKYCLLPEYRDNAQCLCEWIQKGSWSLAIDPHPWRVLPIANKFLSRESYEHACVSGAGTNTILPSEKVFCGEPHVRWHCAPWRRNVS